MNPKVRGELRLLFSHTLRWISNLSYIVSFGGKKTPILLYHRICPLHYKKEIPYANVYPEVFENQMKYVRDNYEAITISEYIQRAKKNLIKGREVCITFDDGFRDNYLYAFPILKNYDLKATFFLTTKYIGSKNVFPWIGLDDSAREDIIKYQERWIPLSWEDIREMKNYGMEFGTHTHSHRTSLSKMSLDEAREEIETSTRAYWNRLGDHPKIFSFPHGTFHDYSKEHIEILKFNNYKAALTTNIGRNNRMQNPYELKRIIIYEEDTLWEFRKKIHGAYDFVETLQRLWLTVTGTNQYRDYRRLSSD